MAENELSWLDFEPGMRFTAQEYRWLAEHLNRYGHCCKSVVRIDAERGDLEMRFERQPNGICGHVRRIVPGAKKMWRHEQKLLSGGESGARE